MLKDIIDRIIHGANLRQMVENSGWLLADRIIRILAGIFVGTLVARYLGPEKYGIYAYTISLVSLLSIVSTLGLEQIVIKELVSGSRSKEEILGTSFVIKVAGSLVLFFLSTVLITHINPGNTLMKTLVALVATSYLFQSLSVIEDWFQSRTLAKYIVMAKDMALVVCLVLKLVIIYRNLGIIWLGYALVLEAAIASCMLVFLYRKQSITIKKWKFSPDVMSLLLRQSWPLISSSIMVMIYMKIDQIMIINLNSSSQTGQYAAAVQLSEAWYFIPTIITSTVYPHLIKIADDVALHVRRNRQLFLLLAVLSYAICIPATLLAKPIVNLLYGETYVDTAIILAIHIWSLLFVSMGVGQSPWVITKEMTKITMVWSAVGALVNVALNLILLPKYGGVGAALSTLVAYGLSGFAMNIFHAQTRPIFYAQLRAMTLYDVFPAIKHIVSVKVGKQYD